MVLEDLVEVLLQGCFGDSWESRFLLVVRLVADDQVEVDGCGWVLVSAVVQGLGGWRLVRVPDWRSERCCRRGCSVGVVVVFVVFIFVLCGGFCFFGVVVVCLVVGGCDSVGVTESMWWCRRVGGESVDVSRGVCCVVVVRRVFVVGRGWLVVFRVGCLIGGGVVVVGVGCGGGWLRSWWQGCCSGCGGILFLCFFRWILSWVFVSGFFGLVDVVVFLALAGVRSDGNGAGFVTVGGSERSVSWRGLVVRVWFFESSPLSCAPQTGSGW